MVRGHCARIVARNSIQLQLKTLLCATFGVNLAFTNVKARPLKHLLITSKNQLVIRRVLAHWKPCLHCSLLKTETKTLVTYNPNILPSYVYHSYHPYISSPILHDYITIFLIISINFDSLSSKLKRVCQILLILSFTLQPL